MWPPAPVAGVQMSYTWFAFAKISFDSEIICVDSFYFVILDTAFIVTDDLGIYRGLKKTFLIFHYFRALLLYVICSIDTGCSFIKVFYAIYSLLPQENNLVFFFFSPTCFLN